MAGSRSAFIQHLAELFGRDAGVLHRVRRLPMPEMFLHGGDVAGFGDDMLAHGVPGAVRGAALHVGHMTDGIPNGIDGARGQAAGAPGDRQWAASSGRSWAR